MSQRRAGTVLWLWQRSDCCRGAERGAREGEQAQVCRGQAARPPAFASGRSWHSCVEVEADRGSIWRGRSETQGFRSLSQKFL